MDKPTFDEPFKIAYKEYAARFVLHKSLLDTFLDTPMPKISRWRRFKWRIQGWRHLVCCSHGDY